MFFSMIAKCTNLLTSPKKWHLYVVECLGLVDGQTGPACHCLCPELFPSANTGSLTVLNTSALSLWGLNQSSISSIGDLVHFCGYKILIF